jgi:2Fe-2S iron-sulfur cluster protein
VGCKRGGCGICKVHLLAGEVRYERPVAESVLSDDDKALGICLSCRAVPLTDVAIELQEGDKLRLMSPLLRKLAQKTPAGLTSRAGRRPGGASDRRSRAPAAVDPGTRTSRAERSTAMARERRSC